MHREEDIVFRVVVGTWIVRVSVLLYIPGISAVFSGKWLKNIEVQIFDDEIVSFS